MITCPYCGRGALPLTAEAAVYSDLAARVAWIARVFLELRATPVFSLPSFARALVAPQTLPIEADGRTCPYCRKGLVTRRSTDAIWVDLVARVLGLGRVYFEVSLQKPGLTWHELATVLVEGSDADMTFLDPDAKAPEDEDEDEDGPSIDPEVVENGPSAALDTRRG